MQERLIKFIPKDASRSDFDCADGETDICIGAGWGTDGSLRRADVTTDAPTDASTPQTAVSTRFTAPPLPVIEFGMQVAGHLSCSEIVAPANVISLYRRTLAAQATSKGLFTQPMLLRYALRMHDDTYIRVSSPILMLPWVLPPCLEVRSAATTDDPTLLVTDFSHCLIFSLRHRIRTSLPDTWRGEVAAVDIFITEPIETFSSPDSAFGGITSYGTVACGRNYGSGTRGHTDSDIGTDVFAGNYSESGDVYADHDLASMNLSDKQVWHLTPNPRMGADIAEAADFYRIASILFESLTPTEAFTDLHITSTDFIRLTQGVRIPDSTRLYEDFVASATTTHCGRSIAAVTECTLPAPLPLCCSASFTGDAGSPEGMAEIRVFTRAGGREGVSIATGATGSAALAEAFPRYIYHADPSAYMMVIRQNGNQWILPLQRHDRLQGAYWYGGLATSPFVSTDARVIPYLTLPETVEVASRLIVSVSDNSRYFSTGSTVEVGIGEISGLAGALGAVSEGQFGEFPLYVFSSDGVWALRQTSSGDFTTPALICRTIVKSAVPLPTTVAALTDTDLLTLRGAKVDFTPLPTVGKVCANILQAIGIATPEFAAADFITLAYDADNRRIILYPTDPEAMSLIYQPDVKAWSMHLPGGEDSVVISRACKCGTDTASKAIRTAEAAGVLLDDCLPSMAVFASDDMAHWRLLGSGVNGKCALMPGRPSRYYKFAMRMRLRDGEYIHGVRIGLHCK